MTANLQTVARACVDSLKTEVDRSPTFHIARAPRIAQPTGNNQKAPMRSPQVGLPKHPHDDLRSHAVAPRKDGEMSKRSDELEQLTLEHRRTIEVYESRLDEVRDETDLQAHLVRSQIEFLLLNVRSMLLSKQGDLEQLRHMEAFEEAAKNRPNPLPPIPGPQIPGTKCACGREFPPVSPDAGERPETPDAQPSGGVAKA